MFRLTIFRGFSDRDIQSLVYFSQFTALKLSQFILKAPLFVDKNFQKRLISGFEKVIKAFIQKSINRGRFFNPDDPEECKRLLLLLKDEFKELLNTQRHSKREQFLLCKGGRVIGEMIEFKDEEPVRVLFGNSRILSFKKLFSKPLLKYKPLPGGYQLSKYKSLPKSITHLRELTLIDFDQFRMYLKIILENCDHLPNFPERIHREVLSLFDRNDLRKGIPRPSIKEIGELTLVEGLGGYTKDTILELSPKERQRLKDFWHEFLNSL
jgi:hypothetical protein